MSDFVHITENSLRRIAGEPTMPSAREAACDPRIKHTRGADYAGDPRRTVSVIVGPTKAGYAVDGPYGIGIVTCSDCRALIDVALECGNVAAAIAMLDAARESRATANAYRDALRLSAEVEADMRGGGK